MTKENKDLLQMFMKLNKMMMRYQFIKFKNYGPYGNPERGQGRVLSVLKMKSEISQKELAYILDMRNQSLGELLAKLEKKGYVIREQSEEDKRIMLVKISEEGKKTANEIEEEGSDADKLFSCLNEKERENLKDYITRLIAGMEKNAPEIDQAELQEMHRGRFGKHNGPFGPHHGPY